ncbi:MAG: hypothetical protein ACXVJB_00290 [Mucilaginibacter sp.]
MRRELNERLRPGAAAQASDGYRCRPLSAAPPARFHHVLFYNGDWLCREIGKDRAEGRTTGLQRHPPQEIQRKTRSREGGAQLSTTIEEFII